MCLTKSRHWGKAGVILVQVIYLLLMNILSSTVLGYAESSPALGLVRVSFFTGLVCLSDLLLPIVKLVLFFTVYVCAAVVVLPIMNLLTRARFM